MKGNYHVLKIVGLSRNISATPDIDVIVSFNEDGHHNPISITASTRGLMDRPQFVEESLGVALAWRERGTKFFIKFPIPSNNMFWPDLYKLLQEGAQRYADASDTNKPEDEKGNPTPLARIKEHINHSQNMAEAFDTLLTDYVSMAAESHNGPGLPEWATKKLTKIANVLDGKVSKK